MVINNEFSVPILILVFILKLFISPTNGDLSCNNPPMLEHARYRLYVKTGRLITIGTIAVYKCYPGYELQKNTVFILTCGFSLMVGRPIWKGEIPICEECSSEECYRKILKIKFPREFKTELCFNSFMDGIETRCMKSSCDDPPAIQGGSYNLLPEGVMKPVFGSVVVYSCNNGYKRKYLRNFAITCTMSVEDRAAVWQGKVPICEKILCNNPPSIQYGSYFIGPRPGNGSTAVYFCNNGYQLIDSKKSNLTCVYSGNDSTTLWQGEVPICEVMSCNDPPTIQHGSYKIHPPTNKPTISTIAVYFCNNRYQLENPSNFILTCSTSMEGTTMVWKGEIPICKIHKDDFIVPTDDFIVPVDDFIVPTDDSQCGLGQELLANLTYEGGLVGGRQLSKPWPWMAAIYSRDIGKEIICSGTIFNQKFVLTAAHCLFVNEEYRKKEDVIVKLGLTNLDDESYMEEFEVESVIVHEYFNPENYDYNIALLQLKRHIQFKDFIRPICMPTIELLDDSSLYKYEEIAVATGWGYSPNAEEKITQHLYDVILPIQSTQACLQSLNFFEGNFTEKIFTERMFCAGDEKSSYNGCFGVRGGPLMQSQKFSDGSIYWIQIGVFSWGGKCEEPYTHSFYTHILNLYPWINRIISRK